MQTFDGLTIQDKLREMLVNPDSENCCIYSEAQKKEYIYHVLKLVVVGGAMCQSEERFVEWKEVRVVESSELRRRCFCSTPSLTQALHR